MHKNGWSNPLRINEKIEITRNSSINYIIEYDIAMKKLSFIFKDMGKGI